MKVELLYNAYKCVERAVTNTCNVWSGWEEMSG